MRPPNDDELLNEALADYFRILTSAKQKALDGPYDLYRYICDKHRSVQDLLKRRLPTDE